MHIFYQPDLPDSDFLPEEEAHHCLRVLRHKTGDILHIADGKGSLYTARLLVESKTKHRLEDIKLYSTDPEPSYRVHLAVAPTKNMDRLEWMLEKAVEFGLDELSLLQCDHSERTRLNLDRLQKKALSAMKQSLHLRMPQLNDTRTFSAFIEAQQSRQEVNYIAYVDEQHNNHFFRSLKPAQQVCILIGPEGDFSAREIKMALDAGFLPVSLGKSRLRTETAALAACHMVHLVNS